MYVSTRESIKSHDIVSFVTFSLWHFTLAQSLHMFQRLTHVKPYRIGPPAGELGKRRCKLQASNLADISCACLEI